jgi:hypothetical protein
VPLFADADPSLATWAGVAAAVVAGLFGGGGLGSWLRGQWEKRQGENRLDRDARIADLKAQLAEKDRQIAAREDSCRLCRQQADDQVKTVLRLHEIYGGCRAAAEAVFGCFRLAVAALRRANARLAAHGEAPEEIPEEPKLWFPDRAEAEFLTRTTVQGQKVVQAVQAVQAESRQHALPQVPEPPGPHRGG